MQASERDVAFWVQFAEIWKNLADISAGPKRDEYIAKAAECLARANLIKEKIGRVAAAATAAIKKSHGTDELEQSPRCDPEPSSASR